MSKGRVIVIAVVIAAVVFLFQSQRHSGPSLEIPVAVDLGVMNHDEFKTVVVNIRNIGGRLLELGTPSAGCACTTVKLSEMPLAPGATGWISFTYHAAQGPGGRVELDATIPSNDSLHPTRRLRLFGKMRDSVYAIPLSVNVGKVRVGLGWEQKVLLRHSNPDAVIGTPTVTTSDASLFAIVESDGRDFVVIVGERVVKDVRERHEFATITLEGSEPSTIRVPLIIHGESSVAVSPPTVMFGAATKVGETEILTLTATQPFYVGSIHAPEGVEVTAQSDVGGEHQQHFLVRLTANPLRLVDDEIRFEVSGIDPEKMISVRCVIAPAG